MSYIVGVNRLYYKSIGFVEDKTVTAYIWSPSLVKSNLKTLTEIELGLYYLDYDFAVAGAYAGLFYEDGVLSAMGVFRAGSAVELAAADVVTALLAATGITEGGAWTLAKALKIMNAFSVMKMQLKSGTTATYEILDPDDGTTVIAELTTNDNGDPPTIVIKI